MKFYYATGTCSLSPHIVARARIDLSGFPHLGDFMKMWGSSCRA